MTDYYKDAKFYLKADWQDEYQEVSREQWIAAERNAGFRSKTKSDIATGGFTGNGISGEIVFKRIEE
jgi:hypothetical protein